MQHKCTTIATYAHPNYFYNIYTKSMQRTSETTETLKTYAWNMRFQHNVTSLHGQMELVVVELDATESKEVVGAHDGPPAKEGAGADVVEA